MDRARQGYINWEQFFLLSAQLSAARSKDPKYQVGAVLTTKDNKIISQGYNGLSRGINDHIPGVWDKNGLKDHLVVHAEINCVLNASRTDTDMTLYCTHSPCINCAKFIAQTRISKVIYSKQKGDIGISTYILNLAGIEVKQTTESAQIQLSIIKTDET